MRRREGRCKEVRRELNEEKANEEGVMGRE